jgi:hypothetical protein
MWEEPRPERIPASDKGPIVNLVRLLFTVALIGGVTLLLSNKMWPGLARTTAPPSPPPVTDKAPVRPPAARVAPSTRTEPARPTTRAVEPPRDYGATGPTSRGDAHVLQSLAETCRYWVAQNTGGQYEGNQQLACNEMTQYARKFGMQVPTVSGQRQRPTSSSQRSAQQSGSRVHVNQCEQHGRSTIDYRQCRASEQDRLNEWCRTLQAKRDAASGERRDRLRQDAQAVCGEASRYQIVR